MKSEIASKAAARGPLLPERAQDSGAPPILEQGLLHISLTSSSFSPPAGRIALGEIIKYLRFADSVSLEVLKGLMSAVERAPEEDCKPGGKAPGLREQALCLLKIRQALLLFCGSSLEDGAAFKALGDDSIVRLTFIKFATEAARRGMVPGLERVITQEAFTFWWEAIERGAALPEGGGLDYRFYCTAIRLAAVADVRRVEPADVRGAVEHLNSGSWGGQPWLKEVEKCLWERLAGNISVLKEVGDLPLLLGLLKDSRRSTRLLCRVCEAAAGIMQQPISGELLNDARETFRRVLETPRPVDFVGDDLSRLMEAARKGLDRANILFYGKLLGRIQNFIERVRK